MKIKTIVLVSLVSFVLIIALSFKIMGASNLPESVEKNGYCKMVYGELWKYNEEKNICWLGNEKISVVEEEFRNLCPQNQFLSNKFYSECFHKGDAF